MKIKNPTGKLFFVIMTLVVFSCAKPAAISGGPRDEEPPKMVEAIPPVGATNFNEKIIRIKFDEYIKLNNINQKLIISPPISEKPTVLISGKGLKITLRPELLLPNTTYSFNFNDAIADNNENNSLSSFVYAFSTGDFIDSLSFSGYVLDAFTKKPVEEVWIILHKDLSDSSIYSLDPVYLAKVDKEGKFSIPYVAENDYKIYALKDNNYDYKYNLPTEGIAFVDSVFRPGVELVSEFDSLRTGTTLYKKVPDNIELLLFTENKQSQYIKSYKRLTANHLEIVFNSTQYEDFEVNVIEDNNAVVYAKNNPDTVMIWLSDDRLISNDSLKVSIKYTDPIYTDSIKTDTLKFRKPEKLLQDSILLFGIDVGNMPYENFILKAKSPVVAYDSSKLKIEYEKDSLYIENEFSIVRDSLNPLNLIIYTDVLEKTKYRIIADSGFVKGLKNIENKLDTINIKTSSQDEFRNIKINMGDTSINYIVQLLQNDNKVAEEISESGTVNFRYLKPGKYNIRVIEDLNNNKRWDTGDLKMKKQPEPVYYYPSEFEVRNKWDHEIDWIPTKRISQ